MTITINNPQTMRSETNGTSYTLSSYALPSGTDRLLLVRVHALRTSETDFTMGLTFDGVSLTEAITLSEITTTRRHRTSFFYLIAPTVTTANLVLTVSASISGVAMAACTLFGAAQSSPIGATDTDAPGNVTAVTLNVLGTSSSSFIFASVASTAANAPSWSWSGATEDYDLSGSADTQEVAASGAHFECDGGDETIVATRSASGQQFGVAVEILAAAVAGGSRVRHRMIGQGLRMGLQPGF